MNSSTMNEAIAEAIDEPMTEAIDTDVNEETSALNAKQRFPYVPPYLVGSRVLILFADGCSASPSGSSLGLSESRSSYLPLSSKMLARLL